MTLDGFTTPERLWIIWCDMFTFGGCCEWFITAGSRNEVVAKALEHKQECHS